MTDSQTVKQLPANPNITQLKRQAKELRRSVTEQDATALERVAAFHPAPADLESESFTLRDAQVTIAREYGFDGWHQLSTHVGEQMIEERDLHRWFGVQLNNHMWDAIEDETMGPDAPLVERERLLYSAYASAYHWRNVGNEANFARGEHLISRMAARLGEGEIALQHARRCLQLVESHPDVMEDWDEAFAREALARALAATGNMSEARDEFDRAVAVSKALADDEDRAIVDAELARGPWFGMKKGG